MAFSDWDFFEAGGATIGGQGIEGIGAGGIDGASLGITATGTNGQTAQLNSGHSRGFTLGRIRSLFKIESAATPTNQHAGLFCMSSVENSVSSASIYAAVLDGGTGPNNVRLGKSTGFNAIVNMTGVNLFGTSTVTWNVSDVVALQLEWQLDIAGAGGIILRVSTGTATDYSDLTEVITYVHANQFAMLSTAFAEGIGYRGDGGAASIRVDKTVVTEGT